MCYYDSRNEIGGTFVNPRMVWESMRSRKIINLKDESNRFVDWVQNWQHYLDGEYNRILDEAMDVYMNRPFRFKGSSEQFYRADVARHFARETKGREYLRPVLFSLFDGRDPSEVVWKQIEPAGNDMRFLIDATE